MDLARWTPIKAGLAEALDLPTADCPGFIAALSPGIRDEGAALLATADEDSVLEPPLHLGAFPEAGTLACLPLARTSS